MLRTDTVAQLNAYTTSGTSPALRRAEVLTILPPEPSAASKRRQTCRQKLASLQPSLTFLKLRAKRKATSAGRAGSCLGSAFINKSVVTTGRQRELAGGTC